MAEWVDNSETPEYKSGVIPIYRPAGRTRGRIFAFHGLGGSWRKTWTHENVFWLRDLLPKRFPDCEICSVGWQRWPLGTDTTANHITEHMTRTPIDRRAPIVFIVHGISPFQETINDMYDHGIVASITSCTPELDLLRGIIFLGSPHHLSRSLKDYIESISAGDGAKAPDYPVYRYTYPAPEIPDRSEFFKAILSERKVKTYSIFQQSGTDQQNDPMFTAAEVTVGGLDPDGLEIVKCMSVPKSHCEMSKFYVETDQSFVDLCRWLEDIFGYLLHRDTSWDLSLVPLSAVGPDLCHTEVKSWNYWQQFTSSGSKFRDKWYHLPANHEEKITNAFRYIEMSHTKLRALDAFQIGDVLREKTDFPLGEVLRAKTDFPHGRYVLPNITCCTLAKGPQYYIEPDPEVHGTIFLRIVIPYIHWETRSRAKWYKNWLKHKHESNPELEGLQFPIPGVEPVLAVDPIATSGTKIYPSLSAIPAPFTSYHPRRTLDQFYHSRLENIDERDNDQVVSKRTDKEPGGPKMIMVDQLWLGVWLSKGSNFPGDGDMRDTLSQKEERSRNASTILTAFPDSLYTNPDDNKSREHYRAVDIRQRVLAAVEKEAKKDYRERSINAIDVAAETLSATLLGMLSFRDDSSLNFLEIFREALGHISETHNNFSRRYANIIAKSGKRSVADDNTIQSGKMEDIKLSLEVADVIDELNMLSKVIREQYEVLDKADADLQRFEDSSRMDEQREWLMTFRTQLQELSGKLIRDYLSQLRSMTQDAERAQQDILHFLDLQQREDNIRHARENAYQAEENVRQTKSLNQQALFSAKQAISAQKQADATDAQNQILFIFTIVTIVFLPLSFITSYYGMNVKDIGGNQILLKPSYVNKVLFATSGSITVFLCLGGLIWYRIKRATATRERIEELATLEIDGDLPPRLLKVGDPLFEQVQARVAEMKEEEERKVGRA